MSNIFISYRRSDSEGEAGRLADDLSRRFGEDAVFMDVDAIKPGRDFRKAIDESIRSCSVLLAVVGTEWFGAVDAGMNQRLADDNDFVRLEIASALKRDIPVVPVLVRGARMPAAETLPKDMEEFAYRNAVELTHARWKSDVQYLVDALVPLMDVAAAVLVAAKSEVGAGLDEAVWQPVAQELARHIGPIALVLVKRAARGCGTVDELIEVTAKEIDSAKDREAYMGHRTARTRGR